MSHIQLREYYFDDFDVDAIVRVLNIQLMHQKAPGQDRQDHRDAIR